MHSPLDEILNDGKDTTHLHNGHLWDANCAICKEKFYKKVRAKFPPPPPQQQHPPPTHHHLPPPPTPPQLQQIRHNPRRPLKLSLFSGLVFLQFNPHTLLSVIYIN
uniref:Uncharacterized protein n=1 Tax=Meloidogyne incognita TaxID=6306 RepID=A0A914L8A2_MELIC